MLHRVYGGGSHASGNVALTEISICKSCKCRLCLNCQTISVMCFRLMHIENKSFKISTMRSPNSFKRECYLCKKHRYPMCMRGNIYAGTASTLVKLFMYSHNDLIDYSWLLWVFRNECRVMHNHLTLLDLIGWCCALSQNSLLLMTFIAILWATYSRGSHWFIHRSPTSWPSTISWLFPSGSC